MGLARRVSFLIVLGQSFSLIQLSLNLVALLASIIFKENFSYLRKWAFLSSDRVLKNSLTCLVFILLIIAPDSAVSAIQLWPLSKDDLRDRWTMVLLSARSHACVVTYMMYIYRFEFKHFQLTMQNNRNNLAGKYNVYILDRFIFLINNKILECEL